MIYNLRKKFILVSTISVIIVFSLIFVAIYLIGHFQLNNTMDALTEVISSNDGLFPNFADIKPHFERFPERDFITPETQFSTRFFAVWVDENGSIIRENTEQITSVTKEEARIYAENVLEDDNDIGWIDDYRFRIIDSEFGKIIVFVNGEMNKGMTERLIWISAGVLLGSALVILLLIVLFSKRVVKPAAVSYEKQKQFITDANHELKTPLTLILTNADIAESELGENEWIDDIRSEGLRMSALVNQLVELSRMDEDDSKLNITEFDLSSTVSDTVSEFLNLAKERNKDIFYTVPPSIKYKGDEGLIRRLISILLDNALKYCDTNGEIKISLSRKVNHNVIFVENTYDNVNGIQFDKLFDRFYRADKARTASGSFGIGLSIANGIAKKHKGEIVAYKKEPNKIVFKVTLK